MADLRVVRAVLVFWVALLVTGASHAADKITLTCSGTMSHIFHDSGTESSQYVGQVTNESVVIDLDRKIVSAWGELGGPLSITASQKTLFISKVMVCSVRTWKEA
jgi:hypothetical protein